MALIDQDELKVASEWTRKVILYCYLHENNIA